MNKLSRPINLIAVCALLLVTACSSYEDAHTAFHASVNTGPAPTVTISNVVGEISVQPSDANAVNIAATKYASKESDLANIDVSARLTKGGVLVQTRYLSDKTGGVRYDVIVPRGASIDVTNTTGTIKVGAVSSNVVVHTATGTIDANLGRIAANRSIDLKSDTGTIVLHMASDSSANVSASSALGSVSSDFESIATARNNIVGSRAGGRVGGGTATVRLQVGTGTIAIDRD